jgi:hypothetical protein
MSPFVSSLLFRLFKLNAVLQNGDGIIIVDAGGGTIDISAYAQASSSKGISVIEIAPPECKLS